MSRLKNILNLSHELILQPFNNGLMLVDPQKHSAQPNPCSLGSLQKKHFHAYIYDMNHQFCFVNENFFKSGRVLSNKCIVNKNLKKIFPNEGEMLTQNNNTVLTHHQAKMFDETILSEKHQLQPFFSLKIPLYKDNHLAGVFGFSLLLGETSLANTLQEITHLGLLNSFLKNSENNYFKKLTYGNKFEKIFLTERQSQILHLTIRGKSSKEIAKQIGLSYRTVQHYLDTIKMKFNVSSKSELISKVLDEWNQ